MGAAQEALRFGEIKQSDQSHKTRGQGAGLDQETQLGSSQRREDMRPFRDTFPSLALPLCFQKGEPG